MLFAAGMSDGPFPEHYEPLESAVKNTFSSMQVSPVITRWDEKAREKTCNPIIAEGCIAATFGTEDIKDFPIICSTYRVTEHWQTGQMTRWLPWLDEMVPQQFVEMSEELAREKGITFGDKVRITSARNVEGLVAYVMITKRLKPICHCRENPPYGGHHLALRVQGSGHRSHCQRPHPVHRRSQHYDTGIQGIPGQC